MHVVAAGVGCHSDRNPWSAQHVHASLTCQRTVLAWSVFDLGALGRRCYRAKGQERPCNLGISMGCIRSGRHPQQVSSAWRCDRDLLKVHVSMGLGIKWKHLATQVYTSRAGCT